MATWKTEDNLYFTRAGFIIPIVSGSLSFFSSLFVLTIIWKYGKISSGYHLIMGFMSINDIMASFAVSMATLPIPSDVIYPFAGPSFGTTGTCSAQGIVYALGTAWSIAMKVLLTIYFLLRVRYRITEAKFKNRIFPITVAFILILSVIFLFFFGLKLDMFNPSPYRPYCTIAEYPYGCKESKEIECIRGGILSGEGRGMPYGFFVYMTLASLPIIFLTMVVSLALIILTYYQNSRMLQQARRLQQSAIDHVLADLATQDVEERNGQAAPTEAQQRFQELERFYQQESHFKNFISVLTWQAIMYLAAFLIPFVPTLLNFVHDWGERQSLQALKLIFQPLNGFFNMLVFVYNKISHTRRVYPGVTYTAGFKVLWCAPEIIPEIMKSRTSRASRILTENSPGQAGTDAESDQ